MANKVTIDVGLDDKTQAGNASVVAGAEQVKQTLEQKHQAMLAAHKAAEEKFARDNAAIFLDVEHEKYAKAAEEFATLQRRNKASAEKFLENATRPLTPEQQQAGEAARQIIQQAPAPLVQKIVNDVEPIRTPAQPAPLVQRIGTDTEPTRITQPTPLTQRVDIEQSPPIATPTLPPIFQRVEVEPINAAEIQQANQIASKSIEALRADTTALMVAFQNLRAKGLDNASDSDIAHFTRLSEKLESTRAKVTDLAQSMRQTGGQPLEGFAQSIENEVANGKKAIDGFTEKVREEESEQAQILQNAADEFEAAERRKQVAATKTANIIDEVRDQERMASERRRGIPIVSDEIPPKPQSSGETYEFDGTQSAAAVEKVNADAEQAAAAIAKLTAEVNEFKSKLETAAQASDKLSDEMQSVGFPEESLDDARTLAAQIDKTRQATRLAADAFDAMGQSDAADRLRMGLAETETATTRLRASINQAGVKEIAADMQRAGNTAQHMSGGLDASGQAAKRLKTALADMGIPKLTAELNRVQAAARGAAGSRGPSGTGIMQLAYAADDLQYGMRGIVNNIPGLLQGLGMGAGLAGVISIAAVAINVLLPKIEQLAEKLSKDGFAKTASDGIEALTHKNNQLSVAMAEVSRLMLVSNDAQINNQASIDALKKEIAEHERLAAVKAAQQALGEQLKENAEKAGDRAAERAREELNTQEKVQARMASLKAYLDEQGGNGFAKRVAEAESKLKDARQEVERLTAAWNEERDGNDVEKVEQYNAALRRTEELAKELKAVRLNVIQPDSPEQLKNAAKAMAELEAINERMAIAAKKKAAAEAESKADADFKREADARAKELKSLDEIEQRLREIETLKRGKSTGVGNTIDLNEKEKKRLEGEADNLRAKRTTQQDAINARLDENVRLQAEAVEKSREQAAELDKQFAIANALGEIEKTRQQIANGTDDPRAQEARARSDAQRESSLEAVKRKSEEARQAAENANADENASEDFKQQKREAHSAAILNQITAEAEARRQKAEEQAALEQAQIEKNLELDQSAIAIRQQAVAEANQQVSEAREVDRTADQDRSREGESRRKKATAELAKAEAEKLKAEAELAKQIETNAKRQKDNEERNQQQATRQRIADEIAIGKAREQAMIAAAEREKAIEDAKNAKRQGALENDPRVKAAVGQIQQRIKPRDVEALALKKRKDAAEARFKKENVGRKIKPGEIAKVRDKAGNQFRKDVKAGKPQAKAELANAADELFQGVVDQTRGLSEQLAKALKALSRGPVQKIIDEAELAGEAEQVEQQKPGDKAAARKAEAKAKIEAEKKAKADAKAKAEREANRKEREAINAAIKAEEEAEAREMARAEKIALEKEEARRLEREKDDEPGRVAAIGKPIVEPDPPKPNPIDQARVGGGNDEIEFEAVADTEEAEAEIDELTKPRVVKVRVEVEAQPPLKDRKATDRVEVEQEERAPLRAEAVTDSIGVEQQPRAAITGQRVSDVVTVEQQSRTALQGQRVRDVVEIEQAERNPLGNRSAVDSVTVSQQPRNPLKSESVTDSIGISQAERAPLAGQSVRDAIEITQPNRRPLEAQTVTDSVGVEQDAPTPLRDRSATDRITRDEQEAKPLTDRTATDSIGLAQQPRKPLDSQNVTDSVSVTQQPRVPLAGQQVRDVIETEQTERKPLAGQSATDRIKLQQDERAPLRDRTAIDTIKTKREREPVKFVDDEQIQQREAPLFYDELDKPPVKPVAPIDMARTGGGGDEIEFEAVAATDEATSRLDKLTQSRTVEIVANLETPEPTEAVITAEAETKKAEQELDELTQPREIQIVARVVTEQTPRSPLAGESVTDTVGVEQSQRADIVGQSVTDSVAIEQMNRAPLTVESVTDSIEINQTERAPLESQNATDTVGITQARRAPLRAEQVTDSIGLTQTERAPLAGDNVTDTVGLSQTSRAPLASESVIDRIEMEQATRAPLEAQAVIDRVNIEQDTRRPLTSQSVTDFAKIEQQNERAPLASRIAIDRITTKQDVPTPLADRTATDRIATQQQPRKPLASESVADSVSVEQQQRKPLKSQIATDSVSVKRDPVPTLANRAATDTITATVDDAEATRKLETLTKPRTVSVRVNSDFVPDVVPSPRASETPSAKSPPAIPDLAKLPQGPPVNPALDAVTKAAKQLGEQQAKSGSEIVNALNKVASLLTDQANRHEQLQDVVAQVTDHVNGLQSQLVAQSNSNTMRSLRAGAV